MKKHILKIIYTFLAFCTRKYMKKKQIQSIWITGSVWKTSCRTVVYEVLKKYSGKHVYTSPKNYNSELGLVFSIFEIEDYVPSFKNVIVLCLRIFTRSLFTTPHYDIVVLEYWIDRPKDMEFLLTVHKPDIWIFTKLDYTHSESFEWWKRAVWEEKFKLFHGAKHKVYLNASDDFSREQASTITWKEVAFYWNKNDLTQSELLTNVELPEQDVFDRSVKNIFSYFETGEKKITTNALGEANSYYIELWLKILQDIGENILQEKNQYLNIPEQKSRFWILEWMNGSILVDSTYNAWPEAMKKVIADMIDIQKKLYPSYKIGFCLGDMNEVWPESQQLHKNLYSQIEFSNLIISVWAESEKAYWEKAQKFISSRKAGGYLKWVLEKTEDKYIILFKWSQGSIFMEEALTQVLVNPDDTNKLCRQDAYWKKAKEEFFITK